MSTVKKNNFLECRGNKLVSVRNKAQVERGGRKKEREKTMT